MRRQISGLGLACAALLLTAGASFGQNASSFGSSGGFNSTSIGGSNSFGSGSSSGNSIFGGSTSGTGFTGGNGMMTGTGLLGNTTGTGTTGRTGATSTQVGSTSFLGAAYANPLALGLSTGTTGTTRTNTAFGNPLYNITANRNATTSATVNRGNSNTSLGAGVNIRRLPSYAATLRIKDMPPPPTAGQVRADLQGMLTQSPQLDPRDAVRVVIDGPAVVLQGRVPDDDERRLVENMVRLTPGVYQVRNELTAAKP